MLTIKKAIKNIIFITIPTIVIIFILFEFFFRIIIPASDPPRGFFNEKERIYHYSNKKKNGLVTFGRFAEIRSKWHINNMGWNYPIDYYPEHNKKLIAVIGDSYIEAFHVDVNKNYPYLLKKKLNADYEVYAFGVSGYALSQYLHISRYVKKYFEPEIFIFNIFQNDFDESIYELYPQRDYLFQLSVSKGGSITEKIPRLNYSMAQYRPTWQQLIYRSALFRYLYLNLKVTEKWKQFTAEARKEEFEANIKVKNVKQNKDLIFRVTSYLVKAIREENLSRRVIFILDAPRDAIYSDRLNESKVLWLNEMLKTICSQNNIELIDLTPLMLADYKLHNKKFNSEIDQHWNEYGHEFVANVLYDYLLKGDSNRYN